MSEEVTVVALKRWGRLICPQCARSSEEVDILTGYDHNPGLMHELHIALVMETDLVGGEKCGVCGSPIEKKIIQSV